MHSSASLLETFVFGEIAKQASSVHEGDFRGLKRLRELLGRRFRGGVVLYDGDHVLPFGERLLAVPLSALWSRIPRGGAHVAH